MRPTLALLAPAARCCGRGRMPRWKAGRPLTGTIRGRVELRQTPPDLARRPNVGDVAMPRPHDLTDRRRSVVYLETAPRAAFDQRDEPHAQARSAQRDVRAARARDRRRHDRRFPQQRRDLSQRLLAVVDQDVRSRPLRGRQVEVGALRSSRHRPRLLRHPLAHERVHPRLRPPLLRGHRRRGTLPAGRTCRPGLHGRGVERGDTHRVSPHRRRPTPAATSKRTSLLGRR